MRSSRLAVGKVATPAPGSIKCAAFIHRVTAPEVGSKRPYYLAAYLLEDVEIPYIEKIDKADKAAKSKPKTDAVVRPPLIHSIGTDKVLISMFLDKSAPAPTTGLYMINGLGYETFTNKDGVSVDGCKCATVTPIPYAAAMALWRSIPFASRSFDLETDVPTPETQGDFGENQPSKLVIVEIGPGNPESSQEIFGMFEVPESANKCVTSYATKAGEKLLALTGGPADQGVAPNQLVVTQRDEDDEVKILILTKLHEDSLFKYGTEHWEKMAMAITPCIRGVSFCAINREATGKIVSADPSVVGTVATGSSMIPDLATMAQLMGFEMSWASCVQLAPRLSEPKRMVSTSNIPLGWANAVNILEYTGNVELIPQAMDKGWVKMYVATNHPYSELKKASIREEMSETEILNMLLKKVDHPAEGLVMLMYAVLTDDAPEGYAITDFVSASRPKAAKLFAAASAKRARIDEDEELP